MKSLISAVLVEKIRFILHEKHKLLLLLSDPTNKANRIEFSTFDPTEWTRLIPRGDAVPRSTPSRICVR